jgi:hypothetical protein
VAAFGEYLFIKPTCFLATVTCHRAFWAGKRGPWAEETRHFMKQQEFPQDTPIPLDSISLRIFLLCISSRASLFGVLWTVGLSLGICLCSVCTQPGPPEPCFVSCAPQWHPKNSIFIAKQLVIVSHLNHGVASDWPKSRAIHGT